jgi:hypothetical protein
LAASALFWVHETMTPKNNKPRNGGNRAGQKATTKTDTPDHTATDPLIGWFNLAKPSRNRQQKRGWQRGARK